MTTSVRAWFGRGFGPPTSHVSAISMAPRIGLTPEVGGRSSRPNHALTDVVTFSVAHRFEKKSPCPEKTEGFFGRILDGDKRRAFGRRNQGAISTKASACGDRVSRIEPFSIATLSAFGSLDAERSNSCWLRLGNAGSPIRRHALSAEPCCSSRTVSSADRPRVVRISKWRVWPCVLGIGVVPDGDGQCAVGASGHQAHLSIRAIIAGRRADAAWRTR